MEFNLTTAIEELVPLADYGGSTTANDINVYNQLRWNDSRPKPAWDDLLAAFDAWLVRYTYAEKDQAEKVWRHQELEEATSQIHRFEDGDEDREPGTISEWRAYRVAVRHWTEGSEGYPESSGRPARPSAQEV